MPGKDGSRRVSIFDTTLRDGEQAPGNAMLPEQKLEIALAIEALGVDVIETGFPSSSRADFRATELIAEAVTKARIATLSRANRNDVRLSIEAGGVENHDVGIMATGSETHLLHKRGVSAAEARSEVIDAVRYAQDLGARYINVGIEDVSRGSDALLYPLVKELVAAGTNCITLPDTTGCLTPGEYGDLVARVRSWAGEDVTLATHCHEDLGLSLANALAGLQAGANQVEATLAGIGERAGNTALEELLAVLVYKGDELGLCTSASTEGLYDAYLLLRKTIGIQAPRNKSIFGDNAFATQAGIHQAGILRNPITYEYVEPQRFGRSREILIGRHSGRNVVRYLLDQLGIPVDEQRVDSLYMVNIENRRSGESMTLEQLSDIISKQCP